MHGQIQFSRSVRQGDGCPDEAIVRAGDGEDAAIVSRVRMGIEQDRPRAADRFLEPSNRLSVAPGGNVWNCDYWHAACTSSGRSFKGGTVWEMTDYGYSVEVAEGYEEAILRTRLALKSEGFSILTEMHVGGLLGPEAGTDRQYLIMGAWSPATTQSELGAGMQVAVHLPCNIVVQETGSTALVAALDPTEDLESPNAIAPELADGARAALGRVLQKATVALG
jgi:uncharacterized protein (DUF302 family)